MTRPAPATIENVLRQRVVAAIRSANRFSDANSFEIKAFLSESDNLSKADAASASLVRAEVYHLCGDLERFEYWLANARRLGVGLKADNSEMYVRGNLGYFSYSSPLFKKLAKVESGLLSTVFAYGLVVCSYRAMCEAWDAAMAAKIELEPNGAIDVARKGANVLNKLGISEEQVQSVLDVAGEVLRRHELFWLERQPSVHFEDDADGAGMLYQLSVGVSAAEAMSMTDEVLGLLFERELYVPGVAFSFISH